MTEAIAAMSTIAAATSFAALASGCRCGEASVTVSSIAVLRASSARTSAIARTRTAHSIAVMRSHAASASTAAPIAISICALRCVRIRYETPSSAKPKERSRPTLPSVADIGILPRDAVARRLNRELFIALSSTAAVLLQIAHPLVAAGVDQHSDFRRDPFGRFHRTANTSLDAVFGDTRRARRALRRIDARHVSVKGTAEDGRRYHAQDPRLLLWVQTTLVLTSLRWYELVAGRLSAHDRQRYWDEGKVF